MGTGRVRARAGDYLPDAVYGANDGLITTFAIVAGVVGADLDATVILILGFANLMADGFSMGASNLLARRSQPELADRAGGAALRHGLVTWGCFVLAGAIPLAAYVLPVAPGARFDVAIALTLAALFVIGASRAIVLRSGWLRNGVEMLAVGSVAAVVAYAVGAFGASITGS